ncbi:MAG: MlaD family protein [Rickettsiales bacterium]|nr:MlaD family protein [Rickettsiales bacterium]
MEQEKYYFRVGILVAVCVVVVVAIIGWFSFTHKNKSYITYAIFFDGSVDGLSIGAPVTFKGINVGTVQSIDFESYNTDRIRVLADIVDTAPVRVDTVASLRLQGITGGSVMALENTRMESAFLTRKDGETYLVIPSKQSSLEKVITSVPELIEELSKMAKKGQKILSDENIEKFSALLSATEIAAQSLDATLKSVDTTSATLSKVLGGEHAKSLESILLELDQLLVEGKITAREIRMLARTIREDPSVILHGVKNAGKTLP